MFVCLFDVYDVGCVGVDCGEFVVVFDELFVVGEIGEDVVVGVLVDFDFEYFSICIFVCSFVVLLFGCFRCMFFCC